MYIIQKYEDCDCCFLDYYVSMSYLACKNLLNDLKKENPDITYRLLKVVEVSLYV